MKDDAKYQNAEKKRVEFENKIKEKEDRKRRRREEEGAEPRPAAMDVPQETVKRGRENDGPSAAAAVPENDASYELASKIRKRSAAENDDRSWGSMSMKGTRTWKREPTCGTRLQGLGR